VPRAAAEGSFRWEVEPGAMDGFRWDLGEHVPETMVFTTKYNWVVGLTHPKKYRIL